MSRTIKTLLTLSLALTVGVASYGQAARPAAAEKTATFKFVPSNDMFYIPWSGNGAELERLYTLVDEYRTEITAGAMPVYVDGYCASGEDAGASIKIAATRSNRVKSELITHKGLSEEHFITRNHATAYTGADGTSHRDVVVVTLRIPAKEEPRREEPKPQEPQVTAQPQPEPEPQPAQEPVAEVAPEPVAPPKSAKPYCLAVRTNVLYDAMLLPTLGVEWRINRHVGIKLDGSLSWWGNEHGKVQKMWLLNPEVRWYLLRDKRFYVGASGSYSKYNIYEFPLDKMLADDTGYQGKLWNAGVTVGYQLCLSRNFSVDFNLGLGYTRSEYDSFTMIDKVRVYKDRDRTKNFWGPTQAGISLVWTIGGNK